MLVCITLHSSVLGTCNIWHYNIKGIQSTVIWTTKRPPLSELINLCRIAVWLHPLMLNFSASGQTSFQTHSCWQGLCTKLTRAAFDFHFIKCATYVFLCVLTCRGSIIYPDAIYVGHSFLCCLCEAPGELATTMISFVLISGIAHIITV